jgi:O-6-methylguanine DNA methyltransferase
VDLLEKDLRDLGRVRAPEGFAERVLAAAGIPLRLARPAADSYAALETPIGGYQVAWSAEGVCAVWRGDAGDFTRWFARRFGRSVDPAPELPERLAVQLQDVLAGRRRAGGLRYDLRHLTDFERAVLLKTLEIPRGEVRTYAWVAREIGRPAAVRAVGTALGHNPIPVLIPCHRVVRSDGSLGEYSGGGTEVKRAILSSEGLDPGWLDELARQGIRFVGSRTTHVFCMPTCRSARRVLETNRVPFRDEEAARAAGYRPCAHCRPGAVSA